MLKAIDVAIPQVRLLADCTSNDLELRGYDHHLDELADELKEAYEILRQTKLPQARAEYERIAREHAALTEERTRYAEAVGTVGRAVMEMLLEKPEMTNQWLRKVFRGGVLDLLANRLVLTLQNGQQLELHLDWNDDEDTGGL